MLDVGSKWPASFEIFHVNSDALDGPFQEVNDAIIGSIERINISKNTSTMKVANRTVKIRAVDGVPGDAHDSGSQLNVVHGFDEMEGLSVLNWILS